MNLEKKQPVVTMTGFVKDPREQFYKQTISQLGMRLTPQLFEDTDVLIVNDVCNQKYKIAKAYKPPITCVSVEWLLESHKKNKIVSTEQYQINKIFHGAHIKIFDFPSDKSRKLQNIIKDNGGSTKIINSETQLKQIDLKEQKVSVVLTNNFQKLKPFLRQLSFPIVGIQWLQQSLKCKICKYPYDYSLNLFQIMTRQPKEHIKKMKNKLQNYILSQPNNKFQYNYLQGTYIYIADNVNKDLAKILKKLIMVLGGYYIDTICPIITHILTQSITENQYGELNIHGSLIFIVRVEWLIDSIYLHKKMIETDYFIRSYKNQMMGILDKNSLNSFNSLSMNTFGAQFTSALNTRKTISTVISPSINRKAPKQIKPQKKVTNGIFKSWNFYVQGNQKRQIELIDIGGKIHINGGLLYPSRIDIKEGHCFYILKDSTQCVTLLQQLKKDIKGKNIQLQPVSYRWINECINKGQFIDFYKTQSYIYKPFPFKTPIIGFHKMIFDILGLEDIAKLRLKQLYNILGSVKNTPNRIQITHCLCGQKYKETTRYKQIIKQNNVVKFINYNWLIECASVGKLLDIDKYLMDKEMMSTIESQNSMANQAEIIVK